MKYFGVMVVLSTLIGCGVDGEPIRPTANANVTLSNNGAHLGAVLGVRKGPLSIKLGL